jgi:ABC-type multidrug transport system fused ATPase/permease subunit
MNDFNNQNNINGNSPGQMGQYEYPAVKDSQILETTQNDIDNQNATMVGKPLLPMTDNYAFDEEESFSEEIKKKSNLLFEEKQVSAFKLYCHLSNTYEIILMIIGTLAALGAGVAAPLMCYLFGDMANDFGSVNVDDDQKEVLKQLLKCKNQDEINAFAGGNPDKIWLYTMVYNQAKTLFKKFDDSVDDLVKKLLIIGACMFVAFGLEKFIWCYVGMRQMHHLKEKYFAVILRQEQGWFDANNAFEFSTKVQAQFEQIALGVGEKFGITLQAISQVIVGLIIAFYKSWLLTLVMLAISPTIFACVLFLVCSLRKPMIGARKTYEKAGGAAEEMLYNIKTVASFSNFEFEIHRFNRMIDLVHYFDRQKAYRLGLSIGGVLFFIYLTFFVALVYTRKLIGDEVWNDNSNSPFTLGETVTVVFSTLIAILSIGLTAPNVKIIQESAIASSDYFTLYEREPQMDFSQSVEMPPRDQVNGRIEFRNVCFSYPSDPNKRMILKNINLVIEPGKKVALVGESGCGKSTTVNLIERLYETTSGEVLIDGMDIKRYNLPYLRTLIGYVQQEPVLFNKPIRDNVIFGRDELVQELGDPEVMVQNAINESYASEFVNNTKDGLNYVVGIKGGKLSGGQKQRIAIARAILCDPKILILDEATSALDNKSEKEVQRALDHISERNVTTVIIAHRLSTIKNADLIYAIRDGQVLESGTHEELLAKQGYYYGLVKSQVGQDEEEKNNENMKKSGSIKVLSQHSSRINYQEVQRAHDEIVAKEGVSHGEMFKLLRNNKCDVVGGIIGSLFAGAITPLTGYVLARAFVLIASGHYHLIWHKSLIWCFIFLVVSFLNGFFVFIKLWKLETLGSVITCNMRKEIVEKYLNLHIAYFDIDENAPGALLTKLSIDTTQLNSIILTLVGDVLSTLGNTITGLVIGFIYDYRLTLISLCFIPFIVGAFIIAKDSVRTITKKKDNRTDIEAGSILSECVINTKTIFSFNFQKHAVDMYLSLLLSESSEYVTNSLWKGFFLGLGAFATYCCNATVFYAAKEFILRFTLEFDTFMFTCSTLMMMITGISVGLNGISDYPKAKRAFISVFKTMRTQSLIPPFLRDNEGKIVPENLRGKIEFRNVTFAYPTKPDIDVLKDVSFVIQPGQSAGLVGYSGCGKSTIIQLIERFYEVEDGCGEVLIDDINIKDYNLYLLRKRIGLVSQEPVLFKRSVYENILYGRLDATKEEVLAAAKAAVIEKFFDKKEMGTKEDPVSGGEKQRLAIARAFLKDPIILLLDEATSALDKESEKGVQASIEVLQKGRTSVAVAHRLSTIQNSDVILVMENGKLVEKGTHEELVALGRKYANLLKYSEQ